MKLFHETFIFKHDVLEQTLKGNRHIQVVLWKKPPIFRPLAVFLSRKLYSLRRQGLFFSWSYFQKYFQGLPSSVLTSTDNSNFALLRRIEMNRTWCVVLATKAREQREGQFPPSTQLCAYNPVTRHSQLSHIYAQGRFLKYFCFLHQGITIVS